MTENENQENRIFNSPEISYEEMRLWRDICEYLDSVKYKTLIAGDSPSIPIFSLRGGWELVGLDRDRRNALYNFHDCQINLVVWYEDRYSRSWKGWKLAKDWYRKIDWLKQVVVLNRDPLSLPRPWIEEREKRQRETELKHLIFQYRSHLHHINNTLSAIGRVIEKVNQSEDRKFRDKNLEENTRPKIERLREQISESRSLLGQIQEIKAIDCPPYAVLGGNSKQLTEGTMVFSPNNSEERKAKAIPEILPPKRQ